MPTARSSSSTASARLTQVEGGEPLERTDSLWRFRLAAPQAKTATLTVGEEMVLQEHFALVDAENDLLVHHASQGAISPKVREVLQKAAALKQAVVEAQRSAEAKQREIQAVAQDQARIRENMRTVDRNSPLYARLVAKLNDQETKVESAQKEIESLQAAQAAKRKELEDWLAAMTVE